MRRTLLAVLAAELVILGIGLTSCADTQTGPQEAVYVMDAQGVDRITDANVIQSVTGNAHVKGEPVERTVTFDIRKHADGSVEGWYNALARGPGGADIKVRLDCLHVVGNQAWAGGVIVEAVNPANIGRPVTMRFIDNGEGVNAPPDEFGGIWTEHDCATEPELATRQVTIGNLRIRG